LQLLDHSSMVVDEHSISGVVDETSKFARHRIAGQQDARLQRLYLIPALALVFIGLARPIKSTQATEFVLPQATATEFALQATPEPSVLIGLDHCLLIKSVYASRAARADSGLIVTLASCHALSAFAGTCFGMKTTRRFLNTLVRNARAARKRGGSNR